MIAGRCLPRDKGFTLIELLVTIAVLVIIATIAIPGFQAFIASNRQAAEYNKVLSGFHYARSEAVKNRREMNVVISNATGEWVLTVYDGIEPIRTLEASNGGLNVDEVDVAFNPLGRLVSCEDGSDDEVSPCIINVGSSAIEVNAAGNISRAG